MKTPLLTPLLALRRTTKAFRPPRHWLTGVFGCCEAKSEPELSVCMCERVRQRLLITTCLSNYCSMLAHERCMTAEPGGYKSVIITGMPVQRISNTVDLQLSSNGAELTVHVLCYCAPDECILNEKERFSRLCTRILRKGYVLCPACPNRTPLMGEKEQEERVVALEALTEEDINRWRFVILGIKEEEEKENGCSVERRRDASPRIRERREEEDRRGGGGGGGARTCPRALTAERAGLPLEIPNQIG
ncbi:hypothetical protein NQZ68_005951 [Dissostichus eleginoides]|nr:hypothetical protein NQZ68_005951 [Dissostichus eleginoides]